MDKLKMHSKDKTQENFEVLQKLFPNAVTETIVDGEVVRAIDKDVLQQEINVTVVEGRDERYQFTWPDKKRAIISANAPINKTLRPCREESVDFDNTENLYIEGDNLEVLKLLQETYLGKIKMIYIDPPYNTGKDFVYSDKYSISPNEWDEMSGELDEYGNRLVQNTENNGRFHTDWMNMIYPRLKISRVLLMDDGVLFVSIGQDEIENITKICNEVYGEENHIGTISRVMKSGGNKGQYFSPNIEYILVYAKNRSELGYFREPLSDEIIKTYNHTEKSGERIGEKFTIKGLCQPGLGIRPNQRYWIEAPDGTFLIPRGISFPKIIKEGEKILPTDEDTCWKWTPERYFEEKKKNNIYFHKSTSATALLDENGRTAKWNVFNKIWLTDREEEGRVPVDIILKWENRLSSNELKELAIPFDFAKPVGLIQYLISIINDTKESVILDFFSGSATTSHAVMQLNAEDSGNRKYIMVQLPEKTEEKSEAYKSGFKNVCEIGKERIRRAGAKIKSETGADIDYGFRVLKLDSSNMKDVYYNPADFQKSLLDTTIDNIKKDRTPEDLLFQVMLDLGVLLSEKIEENEIAGKKVFNVANGYLIACFDSDVNEKTITAVAKQKPIYFVMRDSSLSTDTTAANFDQIFETYSPDTVRKVI